MCVVAVAWQILANHPVFLLSNRDEYYDRASSDLDYCDDIGAFCGRDLVGGGTWLATTKTGRWAVITNYRDAGDRREFLTSRGQIITAFLQSDLMPIRFAKQLEKIQQDYAGFNLILGNQAQAVYMSNKGHAPQVLANGVYVLGNGLLDDDWAKTAHLRKRFTQELLPMLAQADGRLDDGIIKASLDILEDERTQDRLPKTGLSLEWERRLSAIFIKSEHYGTRVSNILMMGKDVNWYEKIQQGKHKGQVNFVGYEILK